MFMYTNIQFASNFVIYFITLLEISLHALRNTKTFRDNLSRSYGIIILLFMILSPIFKNITAQIDSDTIYLICTLFMFVYCCETTKNILLCMKTTKDQFHRDKPIPIEIALLIPSRENNKNTLGNVAGAFVLFTIVSRLRNDHEVLYLLKIGFFLFYFTPTLIKKHQIVFTTKRLFLLIFMTQLIFLCTKNLPCFVFNFFVTILSWLILDKLKQHSFVQLKFNNK